MADIASILSNNPVLLWGGIILAVIIYLVARHIENQDDGREVPEPTSLDQIVKPKIKEHLKKRGKQPEKTYFKIGRDTKGLVHTYVDADLPEKMINPNPEEDSDLDDEDKVKVRIATVKPAKRVERIIQMILRRFTPSNPERKIYVFKEESFLDTPSTDEMIVSEDVMSYTMAGMEVELSTAAKNTINQAVETEVSEKLLASLPNYTEKVDYLFPIHSQNISELKEQAKQGDDW